MSRGDSRFIALRWLGSDICNANVKGQSPHQVNSLCGCFYGQCLQLSYSSAARERHPRIPKAACMCAHVCAGIGEQFNEQVEEIHQCNEKCNSMYCPANSSLGLLLSCRNTNSATFKINQKLEPHYTLAHVLQFVSILACDGGISVSFFIAKKKPLKRSYLQSHLLGLN